jgi:hypothetical protein
MHTSFIRVFGSLNRKAPIVADIAPDAPIDGTPAGLTKLGIQAAAAPSK